jgi:hypothetical protein
MNEKYVPHSFNPKIAARYGLNSAILFHCIGLRVGFQPDTFVRLTLPELCGFCPYLGEKEIRLALHRLTRPGKKAPALVNRQMDNGCYSYSVNCHDLKRNSNHKFDSRLATEIGVSRHPSPDSP